MIVKQNEIMMNSIGKTTCSFHKRNLNNEILKNMRGINPWK